MSYYAELHPRLPMAMEAAEAAARVVSQSYGKDGHLIKEKGVGDLFTEVDIKAEGAALAVLRKDTESKILAEESAHEIPDSRKNLWIVDPLDGSAGFIFEAGKSLPSVLIAWHGESCVELGVILFPLTGEGYVAVKGKGAYRLNMNIGFLQPRRVHTQSTPLAESWVDINKYSDIALSSPAIALAETRLRSGGGARMVTTLPPHSGIAVRIVLGRNPRIGAVVHDNGQVKVKQEPWDVAAPQLFVEEAGGACITLSGERYGLWKPEPFIIANSRELALQVAGLA